MTDWLQIRRDPIEAVKHGVDAASDHFQSTHTGPRTFDAQDYPVAEVLPNETTRADATNWSHSIFVNLYFERSRGLDYVDDVLHPTTAVLEGVLTALEATECITNYHPNRIRDFAGELDNTSVLLVSIEFQATSMVDPDGFTTP